MDGKTASGQAKTAPAEMRATRQNAPDAIGFAKLLGVSFLAGSLPFFTVLGLEGYRPSELVIGKFLVGAVVLFLPIWLSGKLVPMTRSHWLWLILLGLMGYTTPQFLLAYAQQSVDTAASALFLSSIPLFTLLLVRTLLKEHVSGRKWLGFVVGFIGLIIMIDPAGTIDTKGGSLGPYFALFMTCLSMALSGIIVQQMPRLPVLQVTAIGLFFGTLFLVPFGLAGFAGRTWSILTAPSMDWPTFRPLFGLVMMGAALSGLGQVVRVDIIQTYGTAFFSAVGYLVPIWAALLGLVFLDEPITLRKGLAFVVICLGLLLAQSRRRNGKRTAAGGLAP